MIRATAWITKAGGYTRVAASGGLDVLIYGTSKYLNFGITSGASGYGIRDNGGVMQFKNAAGVWTDFGSGAGAVDSVNGQTGVVVLDADDISDAGTTNKFATAAEKTKLGHITVTQAVDLDAMETRLNDLDAAVVLVGVWNASAGTFPGAGSAQAGWSYIVSVAGTVDGVAFSVGDRIIAITDNASTTTYAGNWFHADYTDRVTSVAGKVGIVTLNKNDVGLPNVDDTTDLNKPISTATQTALNGKLDDFVVVSGSLTAANDTLYNNVALATYTDPTPVEGKGFVVFVRNGTATVGGTAYSTAGTLVYRTYHSGAWANHVIGGGGGGTGDVVGPASSVDERIAVFDGGTGKLIQDGGVTIRELQDEMFINALIF